MEKAGGYSEDGQAIEIRRVHSARFNAFVGRLSNCIPVIQFDPGLQKVIDEALLSRQNLFELRSLPLNRKLAADKFPQSDSHSADNGRSGILRRMHTDPECAGKIRIGREGTIAEIDECFSRIGNLASPQDAAANGLGRSKCAGDRGDDTSLPAGGPDFRPSPTPSDGTDDA
jgi:hypothetical protein